MRRCELAERCRLHHGEGINFRDWKHLQASEGNATFKTDDDGSGTHKVFELGI
jgi:hypothetical protein